MSTDALLPPQNHIALRPRWTEPSHPWRPTLLGHNTVWCRGGLGLWNEHERRLNPTVLEAVRAMRPGVIRLPGGTRSMRWRFEETLGPHEARKRQFDPFRGAWDDTGYGFHEMLEFAANVDAAVSLVAPWVDGSPERTAAMVAYAVGDPASTLPLGTDVHGRDWGVVGDWGQARVRAGRESPFNVRWLEVGNEPYLGLPIGPDDAGGRAGRFRQCEQWIEDKPVPTTALRYAEALKKTAKIVRSIAPELKIGAATAGGLFADEDPRTELGAADREASINTPWNPTLAQHAGDCFDFWCVHTYVVEPTDARSQLGTRTQRMLQSLRAMDHRPCAVTEYGFFLGADTLRNAIASMDVVRVCAEQEGLFATRHLLIEDDPNGPFASCAALLGPDRRKTPAYLATCMAGEALAGQRVECDGALITVDGPKIGAVISVLAGAVVSLTLPEGEWKGEVQVLSAVGGDIDAQDAQVVSTGVAASGELVINVASAAVVSVSLRRNA